MRTLKRATKVLCLSIIILMSVQGKASGNIVRKISDPGFPGDIDPGEPLPINSWLVVMVILGLMTGYYYIRKAYNLSK